MHLLNYNIVLPSQPIPLEVDKDIAICYFRMGILSVLKAETPDIYKKTENVKIILVLLYSLI